MLKKFVLIVAGGSGNRMNQAVPKQFLELAGKPILMHTFEAFQGFDPTIEFILVLPKDQFDYWKELCSRHKFDIPYQLAAGGSVRFDSVKNGLNAIEEDGIVFIHDGVRPFVSDQTLQNCLNGTLEKGNALPVVPVTESVRFIENGTSRAVDRSKYFLVQTPQTFKVSVIKAAYNQPYSEWFTDDASVLENSGTPINTVVGNRENIKITYPEDLIQAEAFLTSKL
ncbi:2-C-methyl-D-erythritol 4-phosphate cytidylyltransferase [Maribellus sediminis]|uniref:2-C-methyl-D-erythritol 4-phosphate cytidylyltransferase n=1 Tax=Maribellus sediminis TaxID=2696285 RepID=UPI001430A77F|nr:2-C-methyl-D-erythritol 4-phosphate cytidylyltransferase [Maribellus sediminis]